MKIAVSGSHSTGKTTYLRMLHDYLLHQQVSVKIIANDATACPLPIKRNQTFLSTMWLIANCIKNEVEAHNGCDVLLVDRPVIDAWGYYKTSTMFRLNSDEELVGMGIVASWMKTYDHVLTSRIDNSYKKEYDSEDMEYQKSVESNILSTYTLLNLHPFTMAADHREEEFKRFLQ